ncbi:alpha/beta hydrolase [Salinibacterium sp. G-O1]|uniref:alpha/beta hydrolase n=1 Tax=Salinibacterium sp. G-O1 TaxID=3046208 RepID=UPI0024BB718C|nr:alpha/beta hydrolase [Salinibacterium sp. G-O1]MDJ0336286.1 alpha/beta hydrolase [Salinibacterium sp. G-O1]
MPNFTVIRDHQTFTDAQGVTVHYYVWKSATPKGVVQLAHGIGEHALRYEYLAQALVTAGYTVYADDHRGHGATGMQQYNNDVSRLGRLGVGGLRATIEGVRQLSGIARGENPDIPLVLLGHSWGSLMVQKIFNEHSAEYDAVVLTGTAHRSPRFMNGGDLAAKHRHLGPTGYDWLSRDPAILQAFVDDPLTFDAKVLKLFGVADGLRLYGSPAKNLERDIPLLIMIGSDDSLGGERSVEKLAEAYHRRSQLTDVMAVIYPDARHEVFNEINRDEVIHDLIVWLDARLHTATPPPPAG